MTEIAFGSPEHVAWLAEHRTTGEAAPVKYPTDAQMEALGVLLRRWPKQNVILMPQPFDLPTGYLGVTFIVDKFVCGIAPDGAVSS